MSSCNNSTAAGANKNRSSSSDGGSTSSSTSGAVEQILRNITDPHGNDGQYNQLGFSNAAHVQHLNPHQQHANITAEYWMAPNNSTGHIPQHNPFHQQHQHLQLQQNYFNVDNLNNGYNLTHQQQLAYMAATNPDATIMYDKQQQHLVVNANGEEFSMFNNSGAAAPKMYAPYFPAENPYKYDNVPQQQPQQSSNYFLDNLAEHLTRNNTGTYSPFGVTSASAGPPPSQHQPVLQQTFYEPTDVDLLGKKLMHQLLEEQSMQPQQMPPVRQQQPMPQRAQQSPPPQPLLLSPPSVHVGLTGELPTNPTAYDQFGREAGPKKQRVVAEVKPMQQAGTTPSRPSYSDVLLKSAPQLSSTKQQHQNGKSQADGKDTPNNGNKDKSQRGNNKDPSSQSSKKAAKVLKNNNLNRSNTTNEIKDILLGGTDATRNGLKSDSNGVKAGGGGKPKSAPLTRKWASLDNVSNSNTNSANDVFTVEQSDLTGNKSASTKPPYKTGQKQDDSKKKERRTSKTIPIVTVVQSSDTTDNESGSNNRHDVSAAAKGSSVKKNASKANVTSSGGSKSTSFRNSEGTNSSTVNESRSQGGKRSNLRNRRKDYASMPFGFVAQTVTKYLHGWWGILVKFMLWLYSLVTDICSLSYTISTDLISHCYFSMRMHWTKWSQTFTANVNANFFLWLWNKIRRHKPEEDKSSRNGTTNAGLHNNINMPTTGEEAMKRLLACKGKDPYSILGVTPGCSDEDIKRYYRRQAFLVHPDKNQQPGAEEAFKILVHAFDMIGVAERREAYDRGVAESAQEEQAWSEFTELIAQLQQKVEAAANTIRCSACGSRHKRVKVPDRPYYAARYCATCRIKHSAREGDIWAEARYMGMLWRYFACMEGAVYDITEWAACQRESLKHLRPDSHHVQYRIALGKQTTNNGNAAGSPATGSGTTGGKQRHNTNGGGAGGTGNGGTNRNVAPDLEHLLSSLYGQMDGGSGSSTPRNGAGAESGAANMRNSKRNRKVNK